MKINKQHLAFQIFGIRAKLGLSMEQFGELLGANKVVFLVGKGERSFLAHSD